MIYVLLIVAILVVDRAVKMKVAGGMSVGDSIPVIGDFFHITYVQNTGAAFSMLQNHPTILIVLPAIVIGIGIIFVLVKSKSYKKIFLVSVSMMCAGGLGNLTDRLAYGYVIDMFDFGKFPVFNVADIMVCVGCGLLALYMIVFENKHPHEKEEQRRLPRRLG